MSGAVANGYAKLFASAEGRRSPIRIKLPARPAERAIQGHRASWERFSMSRLIRRFVTDESAATSIEYALIGSFLSVAIVVGAMALGIAVNSTLHGIADDHFAAPAS